MVIRIIDTENRYNVSVPGWKFSEMSIRKGELNKAIYRILDSLENQNSKPIEVYRK